MLINTSEYSRILEKLQDTLPETQSVTIDNSEAKGLLLNINNKHARLTLSLFGGQVLSFINKADNRERLWLSKAAIFDRKTPIRGGIPICWPWFAEHPSQSDYPSHGYARTQMFVLDKVEENIDDAEVIETKLTLSLVEPTQFDYSDITLKLVITVAESLTVSIISMNAGKTPCDLSQALHTYLLVDDISSTQLQGVNTPYDDKLSATAQLCAPLTYKFSSEVDRIHHFAHADYTKAQTIEVLKISHDSEAQNGQELVQTLVQSGHDSTVVWNPWREKSSSMKDMEADAYSTMLCIEAANTRNAQQKLVLEPGHIHKLSQIIY